MKQKLNILFIVLTLLSCNSHESKEEHAYDSFAEGLDVSDERIKYYTSEEIRTLISKTADPSTSQKATIWYQNASKIKEITDDLYLDLDSCTESLSETNYLQVSTKLVSLISKYKELIAQVNSEINDDILPSLKKVADSNFLETFNSKEVRIKFRKLLLKRLYSSVVLIENRLISTCNYYTSPGCILRYDQFSALINQNSKHFKLGDELEITAGVGWYSKAAQPTIEINNKEIKLNEIGYAKFKTIIDKKPGRYTMPAKIKYTAPGGELQIANFEIEYTVE